MNKVNFNIYQQCPQIYIYIFSVIAAILVTLRFGTFNQVIMTLITGTVITIILMGIDFCSWPFQWLTWIIAALFLLAATGNILIFLVGEPDSSVPVVTNNN